MLRTISIAAFSLVLSRSLSHFIHVLQITQIDRARTWNKKKKKRKDDKVFALPSRYYRRWVGRGDHAKCGLAPVCARVRRYKRTYK